jgi:uncharacterized phage infection (PIP) family protein YhgE
MSKEAEDLLKAEHAVQELLSELKGLKDQIDGYANARESLNQVSRKLGEMVERTQTLTEGTHDAITVLKKIGTPQILSAIQNLNNDLKESANQIDRSIKEQANQIDKSLKDQAIEAEILANKLNSKISTCVFITSCSLLTVIIILILPFIRF